MTDAYFGAVLEDIQAKFDFLAEVVSGLSQDMAVVKSNIQVLKAESKLWRGLWEDHERRLAVVEAQ